MARKFKIGDKVKVAKKIFNSDPFCKGFRIGSVGVIEGYDSKWPYPYDVQNKAKQVGQFKTKELKLIERKK